MIPIIEEISMRLAKLRLADGSIRAAIVEDDGRLRLLDLLNLGFDS